MSVQLESVNKLELINARRSPLVRMWSRLRSNRMALVGGGMVLLVVLLAVFAGWISPYDYQHSDFVATYTGPTAKHWLGTDALGRDMFTRLVWGLRSACAVGFGAEVVELTLGILVGALAGYKGGWLDNVLMRLVDSVYAFPSLLMSIVLVVILGRSLGVVLLAVAATSWVGMARIVRSQVIAIRQSGYIDAARGMGASTWTILRRYILPNSMGPIVVAISFGIPANMMTEAGLSLLGLGIQPPTPDLGVMLSDGQQAMWSYPYLLFEPVLIFAIALLGFTFLGDGLRDMFDTKSKR